MNLDQNYDLVFDNDIHLYDSMPGNSNTELDSYRPIE